MMNGGIQLSRGKIVILNLCLAVIAYFVGFRLYNVWKSPVESHVSIKESSRVVGPVQRTGTQTDILKSKENGNPHARAVPYRNTNGQKTGQKDSKIQQGRQNAMGSGGQAAVSDSSHKRPKETYDIIAQKNLFSPNRNPIEEKEEAPEPEEIFDPNSELMVYGTFIMGEYKSALVKVLGGAEKQKATETTVGSNLARYRVTDINDDGITVEDPKGRKYTLNCSKAKKEKRDIRTAVSKKADGQRESAPDEGRRAASSAVDQRRRTGRTRDERAAILAELRKRHLQKQREPGGAGDEAPEPSISEE